jgi:hypothetical protein
MWNRRGYRRPQQNMRGFAGCCVPGPMCCAPGNNCGGTGGVCSGIPPQFGGNAIAGRGINFTYATPVLATLATSSTAPAQNIQFDANSVFVWLRSTAIATFTAAGGGGSITTGAIPVPNINVSITDTGKGASFMNTPVPLWQVASVEPGLPYVLPVPQLIQANAVFSWTFSNFDTTQEYFNVQFQLHGFRVFNPNFTELSQLFGG